MHSGTVSFNSSSIKTYLRNRMSQNKLNGLALLNIHREISVTPDEILNKLIKNFKKLD